MKTKDRDLLPLKPPGGDPGTPRALLPKGSPEWCVRTVDRLRWALDEIHVSEAEFNKVLAEIEEYRAWEKLPRPDAPYGSLDRLLKAELGLTGKEAMRKKAIQQASLNTTGKVLPRGGDQKSEDRGSMRNLSMDPQPKRATEGGVSRRTQQKLDYLARSRPDLHEQINIGVLSVDRAYREARGLPQIASVPIDPAAAARVLRKHFRGAALRELIAHLEAPSPNAATRDVLRAADAGEGITRYDSVDEMFEDLADPPAAE